MKAKVKTTILFIGIMIAVLGLLSLSPPGELREQAVAAVSAAPEPAGNYRPAAGLSALRGNKKMQVYLVLKRR
jgi:hypothetical protein